MFNKKSLAKKLIRRLIKDEIFGTWLEQNCPNLGKFEPEGNKKASWIFSLTGYFIELTLVAGRGFEPPTFGL